MSLLMQALRKAERARSHSGDEHAPEHPFGQDAVPSPPPIEGGPAFAVMPDAWRLEPLDAEPPVIAAEEAVHDPVPPQARHEASGPRHNIASSTENYTAEDARPAGAAGAPTVGEGLPLDANGADSTAGSRVGQRGSGGLRQGERSFDDRGVGGRGPGSDAGVRSPGARPPAPPRAIASSQRRLMILAGALAALVAAFAFIYWRAVSGPGPGARLPMVPMPAPGAAAVPVPGDGQQLSAIPVSPNLGAPGSDLVPPASENATPAVPAAVATPATSAAAAPASKPRAGVTIPTPEQLAAIPDPAIRAEAMRDAAERSARQATMEGPPPPSTATPIEAAAAPEPTEIKQQRQTPRLAAQGAAGTSTRQPNTAKERTALPTAVGENGDVRFVRSKDTSQVAPAIQHGYTALQAGDLATARQQYDLALLRDPTSRDALLGSAAVAMREHDGNQASANYLRLLELDPNDPEALAGLAELRPGDLQANEIKLRGLARQHPESGPVQFALGNLYARQGRWPEAQQSYFRAFTAVPNNADYAFNLGVGLDRMNQPRLAKTYYRRALELAQASPPGFNVDAVRERLQVLETPAQ